MLRIPAASILAIAILTFPGSAVAELYKWTDDNGVLHMATSIEDVPLKYRDQVLKMKETAAPTPITPPPAIETTPAAELAADDSLLQRFEVPYENEGTARRVIIPVKFNDFVTAPMALDTGSPGMVISVELAERLGMFSRDSGTLLTAASGIGGETIAILSIVDSVAVEGAHATFVPTTVTAGLSDRFDGLIGMDFLANYTISIDSRNQVVVFQEIPPDPESRGGHDQAWWRNTFEEFRQARDLWREIARSAERDSGTRSTGLFEFQAREAQRLLQRLDNYASDNAVPRHWR